MKKFNTVEELRNDPEMKSMRRYEYKEVKIKDEKYKDKTVIACTTNQQYEDIIWSGVYDILEKLINRYNLKDKYDEGELIDPCDLSSEVRDFILDKLSDEYCIDFVDVYDEY